jgi:hypothetical protein
MNDDRAADALHADADQKEAARGSSISGNSDASGSNLKDADKGGAEPKTNGLDLTGRGRAA